MCQLEESCTNMNPTPTPPSEEKREARVGGGGRSGHFLQGNAVWANWSQGFSVSTTGSCEPDYPRNQIPARPPPV